MRDHVAVRGALLMEHTRRWLAALMPKTRMSLSEWSARFARLEDGTRYVAFPFQNGIMDAFTDSGVKQISVRKSSRIGYSQIVKNYLGYCADQNPCRVLVYQPTIDDAEDFAKDDVSKVLEWPVIRRLFKRRDKNSTIRSKRFPGGWIKVKGANSPKEFRRITADKVLLEEPDGYPATAGVEGDQAELAFKRCLTSDDPLKAAGSTPTIAGASKIDALFLAGTQEYRYVPCPHCDKMQILVFGDGSGPGIHYAPKDNPSRAWYVCVNGCVIEEDEKAGMDERGEWRAHAPENVPHRSFHIWAGYSQFEGAAWLEIAREFVRVRKDPNRLRVFVNQVLGETFAVKGEAPEWRRLYDRREDYRAIPAGGLVLTAGLDVQKSPGRVEIFVWAWGRDRQSWLIDHIVIPGNPYEAEAWNKASEVILGSWRHASGVDMKLSKVGADTGFATSQVETWARKHPGLVIPVKGATTLGAPAFAWSTVRDPGTNGKTRKRGLRLGMVGGHVLTLELYGLLSLNPPTEEEAGAGHPAGYVHLNDMATEEVCKQLVGDQWLEDQGRWKQVHATEALDGWKYARAVAVAMGVDRWGKARWDTLADAYAVLDPDPAPAAEAKKNPAKPAAVRIAMPEATYLDNPYL